MVEKYKIGKIGKEIKTEEIEVFYNNLNFYSGNIDNFKNKYYKNDWKNILKEILNNYGK